MKSEILNYLLDCCDKYCKSFGKCHNCNHPTRMSCNDKCKSCLEEIHFPVRHPYGRRDYDCDKLINYYVCDYLNKYSSEMLYMINKSDFLKNYDKYNVLSIGSGACPDLIALDAYINNNNESKKICYTGIDVNYRWKSIQDVITSYYNLKAVNFEFNYEDFSQFDVWNKKFNIIVVQYLFSYLYFSKNYHIIQDIIIKIIDYINSIDQSVTVFVNDVNSNKMGRDFWIYLFENNLRDAQLKKYYFETNNTNDYKRVGIKHDDNNVLFEFPNDFDFDYYEPWQYCSSVQVAIKT